ncbi:MAG: hypothetical protein LBJ14_06630 [Desulfarculales bacterium]|jgi:hypothetical protein|nr:hypothetical protein [Desulfarculales bacterium]
MCVFGSTPDAPAAPKVLAQPKENSQTVTDRTAEDRRRRLAAMGVGNSRLSGALGDSSSAGTNKSSILGG